MTFDPLSPPAFAFVTRVAGAYATLIKHPQADPDFGLGGKLFYADELDQAGRALLVAANIAGAATLSATADRDAQKQALRDGVADFVVNTLDEALRILKNQLRKRETVAVCVAVPPPEMEREMEQRGVAPDLFRRDLPMTTLYAALTLQEGEETEADLDEIPAIVTWQTGSSLPKDLAVLDEIALSCLDPEDWRSRRWLRLAPRYLGRMTHGLRLIETHREFAARFNERLNQCADRGEITFAFEIFSHFRGTHCQFRFDPKNP